MGCTSSKSAEPQESLPPRGFDDLQQQPQDTSDGPKQQNNKYSAKGSAASSSAAAASSSSAQVSLPPIHSDIVFAIGRGPSGSFIAGGEDRSLSCFSGAKSIAKYAKAHEKAVSDIAFQEQTGHIYTASRDRTLKQWSVDPSTSSFTLLQTFSGHTLPVSCVTTDPSDPAWMVSGARDYHVRYWDTETGTCRYWSEIQQNVITDIQWVKGEHVLLQASEDLTLRLWDTRTREIVQSFSDGPYFALHCDVSPCGQYFLTGHNGFEGVGCEAKLFDRRTGKKVVEVQVGRQAVTDACFLQGASGLKVLTASKDASMRLWDFEQIIAAGSDVALSDTAVEVGVMASVDCEQMESVQSLTSGSNFSASSYSFASGHVNGRVSVWEFDNQKSKLTLQMQSQGTAAD